MAIEKAETLREREKFITTKNWIHEELDKTKNKFNDYDKKFLL